MRGLIWFREDLRTHDNTALHHVVKLCEDGVAAIYFIDTAMWQKHDVAACRVDFTLRGLVALEQDLAKLHIPLLVIEVAKSTDLPDELVKQLHKLKADALFFNRQYEVNEAARDSVVEKICDKNSIAVHSYHDQVILKPGIVKTQQGNAFSIFTPYKRAWYKLFSEIAPRTVSQSHVKQPLIITSSAIPTELAAFKSSIDPTLWPAGQTAATKRLQHFLERSLSRYHIERDFPAHAGTSSLSPYLATGMISPRKCFLAALEFNHGELDTGDRGAVTWMGELIWRDFYKHLLAATPRLSKHKAYKEETDNMVWDFNETHWQAWQNGQTGYPLIDAAMRQLKTIGWMHNRLRMVVAMFLTKNLFFDWRLGEKYFMSQLIDGDLAANNGGWQWSASTGTDAAPYFRIFNPIRQSERFDPDGEFILRYCPELTGLSKKQLHQPHKQLSLLEKSVNYPQPIIDLNEKRAKVLSAFKQVSAQA